jgi:putative PIN family toxin of toxin-antitoxin system
MKFVADTNVLISGLLWGGPPNQILKWARNDLVDVLTCEQTLKELKQVIQYKRFTQRLTVLETTPQEVIAYAMNLMTFVPNPENIPEIIKEDPSDNTFLAIASDYNAHMIVSGDHHLLNLKEYNSIQIVAPSLAVRVIESFQ